MSITITLPEVLVEKIKMTKVEIDSRVIEILTKELNLNPQEEKKLHIDLAKHFLEEGEKLIDQDPAQASEKIYKAAEQSVKALSIHLRLDDIIQKTRSRGRWTLTDLEKAARGISKNMGTWFREAWDTTNYLHVWGFHEAKLSPESINERINQIKRMVKETEKAINT